MKINEDFEVERDAYQWILTQWRDGINPKTKEPTRSKRQTYHATLEQVCGVIVERQCGQCESLSEIIALMKDVKQALMGSIPKIV